MNNIIERSTTESTDSLLAQILSRLLDITVAEDTTVLLRPKADESISWSIADPLWPSGWDVQAVRPGQIAMKTTALLEQGTKVVLMPPWGRPVSVHEGRRKMTTARATSPRNLDLQEEILLDCQPPSTDARLWVLLPASSVNSERSRSFRSALMAKWCTTHIVFLRGLIPGVHASFEFVLLGLQPRDYAAPITRFFDITRQKEVVPSKVLADLDRLLKMKGGQTELGYIFRGKLTGGESLAYGKRDPKLEAKRQDLAHFGHTVRLGDLFEIRRPGINPVADKSQFCSSDTPGAVRIISGRDLQKDGTVSVTSADATWIVPSEGDILEPVDFLTPSIVRSTDIRGFTIAQVESNEQVVANHNVLVLRPLEHAPSEIIEFAIAYLRSPAARQLYFADNRGINLLARNFGQLVVPVPDEEILVALDNLRSAQNNFLEWAQEAGSIIDSIFDFPSVKEARPRIIAAGRDIRWRSREARNLDDPDFAVRRAFPYPVAHRWRIMEAALSSSNPRQGYESILDTAETLLAFLAQVVLTLARPANIKVKALDAISKKLRNGSGPGMGDWAAVLQETTAKHFAASPTTSGLTDIVTMFRTPEVEAARVRLNNRRNDEAHNRKVETFELKDATESALSDLRQLTKAASFLVDMPLRHVTDTSWDSFAREANVTYREMLGDHWVVKSQTERVLSNELESGSLYITDPDGYWHLLRPFLVVRDCPHCRTISTFHVDTVVKGQVRLKSLENGHTLLDNHVFETLATVGLL